MAARDHRQLNLDCRNILAYPSRRSKMLHRNLVDYPAEVLPLLDFTLNELFTETYPDIDLRGDSLMVKLQDFIRTFAEERNKSKLRGFSVFTYWNLAL